MPVADLIKAILPLIMEMVFFFIGKSKEAKERRNELWSDAKEAIRNGDVNRINNIVNQLRVVREEDNNTPNQ